MNSTKASGNRHLLFLGLFIFLLGLRVIIFPVKIDTLSNNINSIDTVKEAGYFEDFRTYLASKIDYLYPSQEANLVKGLVLGLNDFSKSQKQEFINTGTIHVVVVSGYNITLVASVILASSLIWGRKAALVLSFLGIVFYTFLTGAQPPAVRAAIMGTLAFGASGLGRQKQSLELLALAGGVMLVYDPTLLTSISFQLSYLATLGVIYFNPKIEPRIKKFGFLKGDLANTLSAQILVTPILFFYFGQISWTSPLANLLVLWTVPITTILGFISLILALIIPFLGQILAWLNFVLLHYFIWVVKSLSVLPIIKIPAGNIFFVAGYFPLVVGAITFRKHEEK